MLQLTCVGKGPVFAFYLGSGVEGFKGDHMIFKGNVRGGGDQASLTEYKREEGRSCRKLTAYGGGGVES